jgi:putative ABC transport system permease protein
MKGLPGITHAAYANALPLVSTGGYSAFNMRSPRNPGVDLQVEAAQRIVSPDYFSALRLRILEGRPLRETDTAGSSRVIVVNRSFARRYLGEPAVGARIPWQRSGANPRLEWEVVGIVQDVRQGAVNAPDQPEIIAPYAQVRAVSTRSFDPIVVIRTAGDPAGYISALRNAVREQDRALALDSMMTMDERLATSLARPRTYAVLVAVFAVFAVLIAAVGLFGVLAYSVAQRAREIGVRSALGATPAAIVALVVRQAFWVTSAGVLAGLAISSVTMRTLAAFLYGVQPRDPVSFTAVALLVVIVAAFATVVPARRAAKVDPLKVLR